MRLNRTWTLILALALVTLAGPAVRGKNDATCRHAVIIHGASATAPEKHAAAELREDLAEVYGFTADVISESDWDQGRATSDTARFLVGTAESNSLISGLAQAGKLQVSAADPGPEAYVIRSWPDQNLIVIAGCDQRGTLYGVYKFSEIWLGIDPYEFWTGLKPKTRDGLTVPPIDLRQPPPAFPYRGYFDNDSDMLANFSGRKLIIEFDLWKEMIDSAARLGYNFFDPFDTLGRTEFWVWPYYTEKFPGYHADLDLVNRIIDYIHEKGLMVQVSTYLGYEFSHLDYSDKCLSTHYDDWIAGYRHLIEDTPVGRADMFLQSPRDPWWDRPYHCTWETALGIRPEPMHTRLINELTQMVHEHNPKARVFCNLWSDGKRGWKSGAFSPDPSIDMVWSDNGYGLYPDWPDDFRGHRFGVYIHAGFWRNHVVQDPYPVRIEESTREAYQRGLNSYYFVNGQDFKHFLLNLEAAARAAWDPQGFDGQNFYLEWTGRYFGAQAAPVTVQSLEALHHAADLAGGFTTLSIENAIMVKAMEFGVPYCRDRSYLESALTEATSSLELAEAAYDLTPDEQKPLFDDQVRFPARIYLANLELHQTLVEVVEGRCIMLSLTASPRKRIETVRRARAAKERAPEELQRLIDLLNQGSEWKKWEGWTRVENFRKYQPPPTPEELAKALRLF